MSVSDVPRALRELSDASDPGERYRTLPDGYQLRQARFIIITGSVMSGLGKGIFSSSLAKLLKEAVATRARFAVILDDQVDQNVAALKNIDSGQQVKLPLGQLVEAIRNGR